MISRGPSAALKHQAASDQPNPEWASALAGCPCISAAIDPRIASDQMRNLQQIAERADADAEAVYHAVQKGWVAVSQMNDPHSIALTEAGRNLAK